MSDQGPAAGGLRLVLAIKVVRVSASRLILPRNFGIRYSTREEQLSIGSPDGEIRTAALRSRRTVRRTKPLRLRLCQHALLAAVAAVDAQVGPIMPRVAAELTIVVRDPFAVGRPTWTEVQVIRMGCNQLATLTVQVARPDLISMWTRQMKRNSLAVRAQTQAVWQSFAGTSELAPLEPSKFMR